MDFEDAVEAARPAAIDFRQAKVGGIKVRKKSERANHHASGVKGSSGGSSWGSSWGVPRGFLGFLGVPKGSWGSWGGSCKFLEGFTYGNTPKFHPN